MELPPTPLFILQFQPCIDFFESVCVLGYILDEAHFRIMW